MAQRTTVVIPKGPKGDSGNAPQISGTGSRKVSVHVSDNKKQTTVTITHKKTYFLANFFLRLLTMHPYLMELLGRKDPNKEMLELSAVLYYLRKAIANLYFPDEPNEYNRVGKIDAVLQDPSVVCIIPGDGVLPRAGYLFALYTNWTVISIDPIMDVDRVKEKYSLKNLHCIRGLDEDLDLKQYLDGNEDPTFVLLHIHSHANFQHGWERLQSISPKGKKIGLTIPCCGGVVHTLPDEVEPFSRFVDPELEQVSGKAEIFIYVEGF